jgi:ribonuclease HI
MSITVFTDGSSRGNPGPGGWGAIVIAKLGKTGEAKVIELGGRDDHTTNNRMELMAAIESLRMIRERKLEGDIEIHSDSAYVLNGITKWVYGWERNDWQTKEKQSVLNQDLWAALLELERVLKLKQDIKWTKVEGHSGLRGNERVDEIATEFADKKFVLLFSGSEKDYIKLLGADMFHVGETAVKKKSKSKSSSAKAFSYVSLVGGVIYVDATWAECEKRVKGKKARFKKALSKENEAAIIADFRKNQ